MPIPARSIPTRVGAESLSTGISTELDTHGREAARRAPTLIRGDRTQRGKCCVSYSSIRSHSSQDRVSWSVLGNGAVWHEPPYTPEDSYRAVCRFGKVQRHFLLGLIEPTGALHGLDLLLHRPDLFWGSLHDLCLGILCGRYGPDLYLCIFLGRPSLELIQ